MMSSKREASARSIDKDESKKLRQEPELDVSAGQVEARPTDKQNRESDRASLTSTIDSLLSDIEAMRERANEYGNRIRDKNAYLRLLNELGKESYENEISRNVCSLAAYVRLLDEVDLRIAEKEEELGRARTKIKALDSGLEWVESTSKVYSVEDEKLFFVNRDQAVIKLFKNHSGASAHRSDSGLVESIAIMDDPFGMGKTAFGRAYISKCTGLDDLASSPEFLNSILRAETLLIKLEEECLIKAISIGLHECEKVLIDAILNELENLQTRNKLTGNMSFLTNARTSTELLKLIIWATGRPLFIVLDEVPGAFASSSGQTIVQTVSAFYFVAKRIFRQWIRTIDVFLLLLGRGEIFDVVSGRSDLVSTKESKLAFERIPLTMIHEKYIEPILEETVRMVDGKPVTLKEFYGLQSPEEVRKAVKAILDATNGHPRSMCKMLSECDTREKLHSFDIPLEKKNVKEWIRGLLPFADVVGCLVAAENSRLKVNLTKNAFESSPSPTWAEIADRALIRWEGEIYDATLHISKNALIHLYGLFAPCKTFLANYAINKQIKLNHEGNFELVCLKRFQEIFCSPCPADEILSSCYSFMSISLLDFL